MTLPRSGFLSGGAGDTTIAGTILTTEAHTTDDSLAFSDTGTLHTNGGAAGEVIITLPLATAGEWIWFYVAEAQYLRVKANTGDKIRLSTAGLSAAGGYVRTNAQGSGLLAYAIDSDTWGTDITGGPWTIDS